MGTRIPPPIVVPTTDAGPSCSLCWGSGKPFGDIDTPDEIVVTISGVNKGPGWITPDGEPIDGEFTLPQSGINNCLFRLVDGDDIITIFWEGVGSSCTVIRSGIGLIFSGGAPEQCLTEFFNADLLNFVGGSAFVHFAESE